MVLSKINNLIVIFIIICSTSFFGFSALGSGQRIFELLGILMIVILLAAHLIYSDQHTFPQNFSIFIFLIFISFFTSMCMAQYSRDQSFGDTIYAQRALFYYLFYFLLHQMKINPRDLEKIFISFGILNILLYMLQYFAYPKIIFDALIMHTRGTLRIYLAGGDYLAISYFMGVQAFLRTNKLKFLIFTFFCLSVFIIQGGRQTMGLMALIFVLAIFFYRQVKSRLWIGVLVGLAAFAVFILFQGIFKELVLQSHHDIGKGNGYIRIKAAIYYLKDFATTPLAYITGNGMYNSGSAYGRDIMRIYVTKGYYLSDIGIIGLYIIYGAFFIVGALGLFVRTFRMKVELNYGYIKLMFFGLILAIITAGSFANSDFTCFLCCLLYMVDVSNTMVKKNEESHSTEQIKPDYE